MMNKLMIGCPVKDDLKSLQLMVDSLFISTNAYDEIVFIDGGSTDGSLEFLLYLNHINERVTVIKANTKTPLEAYNLLFDLAKAQMVDLFLTQTDVIFPKCFGRDWLSQMMDIAQQEQIGAITTLNGGGVSGPDYLDKFLWLGGWATYYPNRTIQAIGGYDVNFPNGFGVDIAHTYKLWKTGLKIFYFNYWVDHHQQNSREHDRDANSEQMKQASAKYFREVYLGQLDR